VYLLCVLSNSPSHPCVLWFARRLAPDDLRPGGQPFITNPPLPQLAHTYVHVKVYSCTPGERFRLAHTLLPPNPCVRGRRAGPARLLANLRLPPTGPQKSDTSWPTPHLLLFLVLLHAVTSISLHHQNSLHLLPLLLLQTVLSSVPLLSMMNLNSLA